MTYEVILSAAADRDLNDLPASLLSSLRTTHFPRIGAIPAIWADRRKAVSLASSDTISARDEDAASCTKSWMASGSSW